MQLATRNPMRFFHDVEDMVRRANRRDERPDGENGNSTLSRWAPAVDVYEEDERLVFELEAPGFDRENLTVGIENNRLSISGHRASDEEQHDNREYVRTERTRGSFQRTFTLPDAVDEEAIEARYEQGVLKLTLPRAEEARSRTIDIQ